MNEQLDNATLTALCHYFFSEVIELSHRCEAAFALLRKHEIFSKDEFETTVEQARAEYKAGVKNVLIKANNDAEEQAIRTMLESFDGPKQ